MDFQKPAESHGGLCTGQLDLLSLPFSLVSASAGFLWMPIAPRVEPGSEPRDGCVVMAHPGKVMTPRADMVVLGPLTLEDGLPLGASLTLPIRREGGRILRVSTVLILGALCREEMPWEFLFWDLQYLQLLHLPTGTSEQPKVDLPFSPPFLSLLCLWRPGEAVSHLHLSSLALSCFPLSTGTGSCAENKPVLRSQSHFRSRHRHSSFLGPL